MEEWQMESLESISIHPNQMTKKWVTEYFWRLFEHFRNGKESVTGNINGIQIVIFDDSI